MEKVCLDQIIVDLLDLYEAGDDGNPQDFLDSCKDFKKLVESGLANSRCFFLTHQDDTIEDDSYYCFQDEETESSYSFLYKVYQICRRAPWFHDFMEALLKMDCFDLDEPIVLPLNPWDFALKESDLVFMKLLLKNPRFNWDHNINDPENDSDYDLINEMRYTLCYSNKSVLQVAELIYSDPRTTADTIFRVIQPLIGKDPSGFKILSDIITKRRSGPVIGFDGIRNEDGLNIVHHEMMYLHKKHGSDSPTLAATYPHLLLECDNKGRRPLELLDSSFMTRDEFSQIFDILEQNPQIFKEENKDIIVFDKEFFHDILWSAEPHKKEHVYDYSQVARFSTHPWYLQQVSRNFALAASHRHNIGFGFRIRSFSGVFSHTILHMHPPLDFMEIYHTCEEFILESERDIFTNIFRHSYSKQFYALISLVMTGYLKLVDNNTNPKVLFWKRFLGLLSKFPNEIKVMILENAFCFDGRFTKLTTALVVEDLKKCITFYVKQEKK